MQHLPHEITSYILHLTGPHISVASRVCVTWRALTPETKRPLTLHCVTTEGLLKYVRDQEFYLIPVLKLALKLGHTGVYMSKVFMSLLGKEVLFSHEDLKIFNYGTHLTQLTALKWITSHTPWRDHSFFLMSEAAGSGNLLALKYLVENRTSLIPREEDKDFLHPLANAVAGGHLECLEYAISLDWPEGQLNVSMRPTDSSIPCLEWLVKSGHFQLHAGFVMSAVFRGDLILLRWLIEQKAPMSDDLMRYVNRAKTIETLEILLPHYTWRSKDNERAAFAFSLDILKWLDRSGVTWDSEVYFGAVTRKTEEREVVDFFLQQGIPFGSTLFRVVVTLGKLELLKYLRSKGLPWNRQHIIQAAIASSKLEIAEYLLQEGCQLSPMLYLIVSSLVEQRGMSEEEAQRVRQWLAEHGLPP